MFYWPESSPYGDFNNFMHSAQSAAFIEWLKIQVILLLPSLNDKKTIYSRLPILCPSICTAEGRVRSFVMLFASHECQTMNWQIPLSLLHNWHNWVAQISTATSMLPFESKVLNHFLAASITLSAFFLQAELRRLKRVTSHFAPKFSLYIPNSLCRVSCRCSREINPKDLRKCLVCFK